MAVSHNINVNLKGSNKFGSRNSPMNRLKRITSGGSGKNGPESLSKQIRRIGSNVDEVEAGFVLGVGLVATEFVLKRMKSLTNRGIEIGLQIEQARTGETVSTGNFRRVKNYVMNPKSYLVDVTYGRWLRGLEVNRANASNEYYRQLTGEIIVGNQYGTKR